MPRLLTRCMCSKMSCTALRETARIVCVFPLLVWPYANTVAAKRQGAPVNCRDALNQAEPSCLCHFGDLPVHTRTLQATKCSCLAACFQMDICQSAGHGSIDQPPSYLGFRPTLQSGAALTMCKVLHKDFTKKHLTTRAEMHCHFVLAAHHTCFQSHDGDPTYH